MPVIDVAHQRLLTARALHVAQLLTGKSKYKVLGGGAIIAGSRVAAGLDGFERVKVRSSQIYYGSQVTHLPQALQY